MQFQYRTDIKFTPPVCKSRSYKDEQYRQRHYTTLLPSGAGHYWLCSLVKIFDRAKSEAVNDVQTVGLFGNFESRELGLEDG